MLEEAGCRGKACVVGPMSRSGRVTKDGKVRVAKQTQDAERPGRAGSQARLMGGTRASVTVEECPGEEEGMRAQRWQQVTVEGLGDIARLWLYSESSPGDGGFSVGNVTHFDLDVKGSLWLLSGARDRSCRLVTRPVGLLEPEVCGSGRQAGVMGEHCTAWRAGRHTRGPPWV